MSRPKCSLCGDSLAGMTISCGMESFHPDCFKKTPKGQEVERVFQEWLKNHRNEIYEQRVLDARR